MTGGRCTGDRGSAGVEAAFAVTALLLVAFFVIGAMRIVGAGGDVNAAARAAARAAAATYDLSAAQAAAEQVAAGALGDRGVACRDLAVTVAGDLTAGSVVAVDVTCTVSLGDVTLVGFSPSRTVSGRGVEQVDIVRGGAP